MPEFQMPKGDKPATFDKLAPFVRGYLEALFFTDCGPDSDDLKDATFADMASHTVAYIVKDCETWQATNAALLALAYERDYDAEQAGRDYWFTRNGHGVGFWDREALNIDDLGDKLSDACRYHAVNVYRGDDGRVYVDNEC